MLLLNAWKIPDPASTMKGTMRHQYVSKMRPGTMSRKRPIATPMPARMDAPITGRM
jgi:hypothetical protein